MFKNIFVFLSYVSIALLTFAVLYAFNEKAMVPPVNSAEGKLINYSECKIPGDTSYSYGHSSSEDCIDFRYDSTKTLYLRHINSGFSLCPGELTAKISITADSILIEEFETESGCYEMCLYNLDYVLSNINPGVYSVRVVSPYPASKDPLEFNIDLTECCSGSFYVARNEYPWGT